MKHVAGLLALILVVAPAAGVVNYTGPTDQPHIMSSGSSSATSSTAVSSGAAADQDGTLWTAETSMVARHPNISIAGKIENVEYSVKEGKFFTSFTGYILAPTPCHTIDHDITEVNGSQVLNVQTVNSLSENSACIHQVVVIEYNGSFTSQQDFGLEIRHNEEPVGTLDHPREEINGDSRTDRTTDPLTSIFNWLMSLV